MKSQNIRELSKDLFLGLDSFVFWDDNPIERNKVRNEIGDVEVIEPTKDVSYWSKQLLEYTGFSKFQITKEDYIKTKQYKSRNIFRKKKSSKNEIAYLKKKIKTKLFPIQNDNIGRASQLTEKTNQFNFNTRRYKIEDLKTQENTFFAFWLKNIWRSWICWFFYIKKNKETMLVDLFIMSCRIMGRYLENWILNEIKKIAINNKKKKYFI